ncbi:MAG: NHL repeat-containing protein [Chloroflexi bacterium]|nr:NHL repeat-containing protein [Chloroflexota bacterium]
MAIEDAVRPQVAARPYALLRAGFPYYTTLGMRRVTTYPMDIVIGDAGRIYVLCRDDGAGASIRRTNWDDEDLDTISGNGTDEGKLLWPVQMIRDGGENLYVSDEATHRISAFSRDGTFLGCFGKHGSEPGQLDRPSGIAFDADENLFVVDTMNHRVQKFTKDGRFLQAFGSHGSGEGQFDMPWGIAVDNEGSIYVSDWRNDRVQKFTANGDFIMAFGTSGSGDGELNRPAGVAVDVHGDIYVVDRGNHRVQLFNRDGQYVEQFLGDATLSKSGRRYVLANPKVLRGREMTTLEHTRRLRGPTSVRVDDEGRMYVPDYGSHRIQVYKKEAYPLTEADIWAPPKAPFLYNV